MKRVSIMVVLCSLWMACIHSLSAKGSTMITNNSQQHDVSGVVTDAQDGSPLPGVNIVVKGTTIGTATSKQGEYSLTVPSESDTLIFSFIGYQRQEIPINGQSTINVALQTQELLGEELVVTGYQTQRKVDLTGAIETVDLDAVQTTTSGNVMQSLQGRVPGLFVEKTGSPTGAPNRILIRGVNTLGNNDPLYIIDGVPTKRAEVFQDLDPASIQSVQVLKDAASASIFGARASNGVIVVTTKDGGVRQGKVDVKINYSSSLQSEKPQRFDMLNAVDRGRALWRASVNDGVDPSSGYGEIYTFDWNGDYNNPVLNSVTVNPYVGGDPNVPAGDTDWQAVSYDLGHVNNIDLNVAAGSDNSSMSMDLGYIKNTGMLKYTNYDRITGRVNATSSQFDDRVKFGINTMMASSNETLQTPDLGSAPTPGLAITLAPTIPVYTKDGQFAGPIGSGYSDRNNPVHMQYINRWDNTNRDFVFGNAYTEVTPIENLVFRSSIGLDYSTYKFKNIEQAFEEGFIARPVNSLINTENKFVSVTWSNTVDYKVSLGDHQIDVLAGVEAIKDDFNETVTSARDFATQTKDFFVISAASGTKNSLGTASASRLLSQFGKLNYSYGDRYLASITLRRDGSSRFGADNRYGFFPSVSVGWRINNENFMQNVDFLSNLKLRAGLGRVGNQDIGDFASLGLFEPRYGPVAADVPGVGHQPFFDQYYNIGTAYDLNGADTGNLPSGFVSTQAANPALKWETTDELNVGVDFGFFQERLVGAFDYFYNETSDILIRPPVTSAVGEGQLRFLNGATKENRGWELSLAYNGNRGKDFTYTVSTSFSRFRDKITKLPEEVRTAFPGNVEQTILGHSELSIFGYRTNGLFQSQEEVDNHASQVGAAPGRIRYVDLNNDGKIDALDQEFLGTQLPGLEYSLRVDLGYKNFDFSLFGSGIAGRVGFDSYTFYNNFIRGRENVGPGVFDGWTPQHTNTDVPALSLADANNETRTSDYFMVNTSYFKLRNIQLGYTLPPTVLDKVQGLRNVRVYLLAQNLFWFKSKDFEGPDPERTDINTIPIPTTYTVGLNVAF